MLPLLFDWDAANVEHARRQGLSPEEAEDALLDPDRIGMGAYAVNGERRSMFVGSTAGGRTLFVVTATRRRRVRVVAAREAAERERRHHRHRRAQT